MKPINTKKTPKKLHRKKKLLRISWSFPSYDWYVWKFPHMVFWKIYTLARHFNHIEWTKNFPQWIFYLIQSINLRLYFLSTFSQCINCFFFLVNMCKCWHWISRPGLHYLLDNFFLAQFELIMKNYFIGKFIHCNHWHSLNVSFVSRAWEKNKSH